MMMAIMMAMLEKGEVIPTPSISIVIAWTLASMLFVGWPGRETAQ